MNEQNKYLLEVNGLKTYFDTSSGIVKAVNDVSFRIKPKEIVGLVGESGCGKSVTSLSIMQLVAEPGKIVGGEILFNGQDLLKLKKQQMREIRGNTISMIFQEPMSSLNPVLKIGEQLTEPLITHLGMYQKDATKKAIELIQKVEIPRAEEILRAYPHELSGGMLQRVMIAIALSCDPKLLIADEPTTALDVTIQAQILEIMRQVKNNFDASILLITHDLGVVAETADYVVVMYAGKVIEEANVMELFKNPKHPYTQGLLKSKPILGSRQKRLYSIRGQVPNLVDLKEHSCYFHDRCDYCKEICKQKVPDFITEANGHKTACVLYGEEQENG